MAFDELSARDALSCVVGDVPDIGPGRKECRTGTKVLASIEQAICIGGLRNGGTVSFHHHFRNGDRVMNMVLAEIDRLGLRDIRVAASSIFPGNAILSDLIERGVVTRIVTDYIAGPVTTTIMSGALRHPLVLQSHGGRARAITSGQLQIDIAFIGASLATNEGAATGRFGPCPCGPLGYAMVDAAFARKVIVVTQAIIAPTPLPFEIPATHIDHVVEIPEVGDRSGIGSGTTVAARTPEAQYISSQVSALVDASGLLTNGFSFQTGAGGYSLAAVPEIGKAMLKQRIRGAFISGGITGEHVKLLRADAVDYIYDVQCFDNDAIHSSATDWNHLVMSADIYANPSNPNAVVDSLSVMLMGAVEVDRSFSVNVVQAGDGRIIGGPGGHPDTAEGCQLAIVTTTLTGGGFAKLVEGVGCTVTRGKNVDAIVTDFGFCINPAREDLATRLKDRGIVAKSFNEMLAEAQRRSTRERLQTRGTPRVIIEDRHGEAIDVICA